MTDSGDRGGSGLLKAPTPFDYSYFSALVDAPVQEAKGWKLVPTSPTPDMLAAGCEANPTVWTDETDANFAEDVADDVYRAMLAAAPQREAAKEWLRGKPLYDAYMQWLNEDERETVIAALRTVIPTIADLQAGQVIIAVARALSGLAATLRAPSESEAIRALTEALEPFAKVAENDIGEIETDDDYYQQMSHGFNRAPLLRVSDFRRARAAIERSKP